MRQLARIRLAGQGRRLLADENASSRPRLFRLNPPSISVFETGSIEEKEVVNNIAYL